MFSGTHISIEGMDGVGKTSTCSMLAEHLGFEFVEKPLKYLFDEEGDKEKYIRIRDYVNAQDDRVFTSWFYALGSTYLYNRYSGKNIITDRHLISNYMWSGTLESEPVFRTLVECIGAPTYTVVLYASQESIRKRLISRNTNDSDLKKVELSEKAYSKAKEFFEKYPMPHMFLDTSDLSPEAVCRCIEDELKRQGVI